MNGDTRTNQATLKIEIERRRCSKRLFRAVAKGRALQPFYYEKSTNKSNGTNLRESCIYMLTLYVNI